MMDAASNTRFLHVANGTSTTSLIAAAGIPGDLSIWADPLYEGPVPGDLDDEALLEARTNYLSGGSDAPIEPVNDLGLWRAAIERHHSYDELVLWYEHDLFDQLNLIQVLTWIRDRVPAEKAVSLVSVGSFAGRPDFKGMGELTPRELGSLLPTRQRVTEGQYASAAAAWSAFRQATPQPLDTLRRRAIPGLPFLARALTRFLQEYPWTTDGLSRSERHLLQLAAGEGTTLDKALPRMHDGEDAYYITDLSLAALAGALTRLPAPLLTLTLTHGDQSSPLSGHVSLTNAGAAVLSGDQGRVGRGGVDRWLGGVHLQSQGPVWRWYPSRHEIVLL